VFSNESPDNDDNRVLEELRLLN